MLANKRREAILKLLREHGAVQTGKLMKLLDVTGETLRKDFIELEKHGLLQRVHGGAVQLKESARALSLDVREEQNTAKKRELARYALPLIEDGSFIALDGGTTGNEMARAIAAADFKDLTVMTYSLTICEILRNAPGVTVMLTGGTYLPDFNEMCGQAALDTLENHHFAKAILCVSGVSLSFGVSDCYPKTYPIQRAMLRHASQVIVLADSSKFEKNAELRIAPLTPALTLVTDSGLDEELRTLYREAGVHLICESEN